MNENTLCPCKRTGCPRHGDCAACREHHAQLKGKALTACERQKAKEARRAGRKRDR